jgi:hypothetical protein
MLVAALFREWLSEYWAIHLDRSEVAELGHRLLLLLLFLSDSDIQDEHSENEDSTFLLPNVLGFELCG